MKKLHGSQKEELAMVGNSWVLNLEIRDPKSVAIIVSFNKNPARSDMDSLSKDNGSRKEQLGALHHFPALQPYSITYKIPGPFRELTHSPPVSRIMYREWR